MENKKLQECRFLSEMYADGYFPHGLVDEGVAILERLCHRIEYREVEDNSGTI